MGIRQTLKEKPGIGYGISGGLFAIAFVVMLSFLFGSDDSNPLGPPILNFYYYDITDGKLFSAPAGQLPPINAPSGEKKGVRAYVYACGDCSDESERFIAYLEVFNEAGLAQRRDDSLPHTGVSGGKEPPLIKTEKGPDWVSAESPEAVKIMSSVGDRCNAKKKRLIECHPD